MSTFRVRASSLGEVAAQLQSAVAVFDGHVSSVTSKVASVSGATWAGDDQTAFQAKWEHWQQTADLVRMSLTTLAAQLVAAEGSYTTTESSVQSSLVQRRQANEAVVEQVEEVDEAVDTGLDRARTAREDAPAVQLAGAMTVRTGRGAPQTSPDRAAQAGGDDE